MLFNYDYGSIFNISRTKYQIIDTNNIKISNFLLILRQNSQKQE